MAFVISKGKTVFFGAVSALAFDQDYFLTPLLGMGLIGGTRFFQFSNLWKPNALVATSTVPIAGGHR